MLSATLLRRVKYDGAVLRWREDLFGKTYLERRFPRAFGFLVVLASLNPVEFCCNSWLALVLGRRGDGFPVPGRTGAPALALLVVALRMRITMLAYKLALKAHILMVTPNHCNSLTCEWPKARNASTRTLILGVIQVLISCL